MAYWLKIIKDGKVEMIELDPKNPKTIKLKGGSHYELLDEQLNPIEPLKIIEDQAGLTLYTEAGDAPSLILQNYTRYQPLVSGGTITLNSDPVLASQVFSKTAAQGISSSLLWAGGGILAAGAVAAVALSGGGSKSSGAPNNSQANTDTASQPSVDQNNAQNTTVLNGAEQQPIQPKEDITPTEKVTVSPTTEEEKPTVEETTSPTVEEEKTTVEETTLPTVEEEKPTIEETSSPTAEEEKPTAEETTSPTVEETTSPTAEEEKPTVEETTSPTVEEEKPTVEETTSPTVEEEKPTVEETTSPTVEEEKPTVEETTSSTTEEEKPTVEETTSSTTEEEKPTVEETTSPTVEEEKPTVEETTSPTVEEEKPTDETTTSPTVEEEKPTVEETTSPTAEEENPTDEITASPTAEEENPTVEDTASPTAEEENPTVEDTASPTAEEENPTDEITASPTAEEENPTVEDTASPTAEEENPTDETTTLPTVEEEKPTVEETTSPTVEEEKPTVEETSSPTTEEEKPTVEETTSPTVEEEKPTVEETTSPTVEEEKPTVEETSSPTAEEEKPTVEETTSPTVEEEKPTDEITASPTAEEENPTDETTASPSAEEENPTDETTASPSAEEENPTDETTASPSAEEENPTVEDTASPTAEEENPTEKIIAPPSAEEEKPTDETTASPTVEEEKPRVEDTASPSAEEENPTDGTTASPTAEEENPTDETSTPPSAEEENPTVEDTASPSAEEENPTVEEATRSVSVKITEVGEVPRGELVRLSGRVDPSGTEFAKFRNLTRLEELSMTLNNKTYAAGVDSQGRFVFDIARSELAAAKGQGFSVTYNNQPWLYDLNPNGSSPTLKIIPLSKNQPLLNADNLVFDDNAYIQGGKVVDELPAETVRVQGVTNGATDEDWVTVRVGEETVRVQPDSQGHFSVNISAAAFQANTSGQIAAELRTSDDLNAQDQYLYALPRQLSGEFVTTFAHSVNKVEEMPYFLAALIGPEIKTVGHLGHDPMNYAKTHILTYSFNTDRPGDVEIDQENRAALRKAFNNLSYYANLEFKQVADNTRTESEIRAKPENQGKADSEMVWSDIIYHYSATEGTNRGDYGGYVIYSARNTRSWAEDSAQYLLYHETFHSLGAMHAHDEGFAAKASLPYLEDQNALSVMTYSKARTNTDITNIRLYDLIYLHFRYGVNPNTRAGNDVYSFKEFDRYQVDGNVYIWDGAGVDTFDASMENTRVVVDLTPGSWIYRGEKSDTFVVKSFETLNSANFFDQPGLNIGSSYFNHILENVHEFQRGQAFIGYGTQIERLIGSRFDDELKGNVADNDIFGGEGHDQIWGNAGNDYLDGGKGADTMYGGLGDDIFVVDNQGDRVEETYDQGNDTVLAYIDYRLGENVENLTLLGTAVEAHGNALDNRISGNAQANTLSGGAGADTFVFNTPLNGNVDNIIDFDPSQDRIELAKAVFTALTEANLHSDIQYDPSSGNLSYLADGQTTVFARLPSALDAEQLQFVLG